LDRTPGRNRHRNLRSRVEEYKVATTTFPNLDTVAPCYRLQQLHSPISRIRTHPFEELPCFAHARMIFYMVSIYNILQCTYNLHLTSACLCPPGACVRAF